MYLSFAEWLHLFLVSFSCFSFPYSLMFVFLSVIPIFILNPHILYHLTLPHLRPLPPLPQGLVTEGGSGSGTNLHASTSLLNDAHLFNVLHAIERTAEGVDLRAQPGGDVRNYLRSLVGQKNKRQRGDGHGEEVGNGSWLRGGVKSAPVLDEDKKKKRRSELGRKVDGAGQDEK